MRPRFGLNQDAWESKPGLLDLVALLNFDFHAVSVAVFFFLSLSPRCLRARSLSFVHSRFLVLSLILSSERERDPSFGSIFSPWIQPVSPIFVCSSHWWNFFNGFLVSFLDLNRSRFRSLVLSRFRFRFSFSGSVISMYCWSDLYVLGD